MAQILDYAPPPMPLIGRKILQSLPLSLGATGYAILCWPPIYQNGYPPVDHFWTGATFLWIFLVPLFTLNCPPGRFSRGVLLAYALITAYSDGCTEVPMNPYHFHWFYGLLMLPFFGPIHLVVVGAIAWISRVIYRALHIATERQSPEYTFKRNIGRIIAVAAIGSLAMSFPFVFRVVAIAVVAHQARAAADHDWAEHSAYILSPYGWMLAQSVRNYDICSYFDANSGLPLRPEFHREYEPIYSDRMQELLRINGIPPWSHKRQLVSQDDLLGMFTAAGMTPVTAYPYDISPSVVLSRGGTVYRWGGSFTSGSNDLYVDTEFGGNFGWGYVGNAVICRVAKYPHVIFVRGGDEWVAAVSEDGWILESASKAQ